MSAIAIREIPATERPRERLRQHGAQALSAVELVAILFGSGRDRFAGSPRDQSHR